MVAIWVPLAALSPAFGAYTLAYGRPLDVEPRRELALGATASWHAMFGQPLKLVAGSEKLAAAVTFYSPDAPSYYIFDRPEYSPWVTREALQRDGLLIVCSRGDRGCLSRAAPLIEPDGLHASQEFARSFLGHAAAGQTYDLFTLPPASLR